MTKLISKISLGRRQIMILRQKSTESTDISSDSGHSNRSCNDSNKISRGTPKTTTSGTTSSSGRSRTNKNKVVTFAASVKAKKTLHVKNYTLDDNYSTLLRFETYESNY